MSGPIFETESAPRLSIRAEAIFNEAYLHVIKTGAHAQVAVMTLPPDGSTAPQSRLDTDQVFVIASGAGEALVGPDAFGVEPGDLVFVRAGTPHELVNRTVAPMHLIVVMAPPVYPAGAVIEAGLASGA